MNYTFIAEFLMSGAVVLALAIGALVVSCIWILIVREATKPFGWEAYKERHGLDEE